MNDLKSKLNEFKQTVIENCKNDNFEYREWFIKDHLDIVEKISMELCDIYKEADRDLVFALVWFHDFGKPIDSKNERVVTEEKGISLMKEIGFTQDFIDRVFNSWIRMEMKNEIDISKESIEVKIVSSADGASHFVGKFYSTYFMDDKKENIEITEKRIADKIKQDWEKKIVITEVKEAFREKYLKALEITGKYPDKFIIIQ